MPGQLFSPFTNIDPGKPFPTYQDGNNNPKAAIKKSEALIETESEDVSDSTRYAIKKVSLSLEIS
jgi:hypothetical protein